MSQEFIGALLSELLVHKENEEQVNLASATSILYPAFVQDCVEFILTLMMPINKSQRLKSYKDLLQNLEMPDWLPPLIKSLYFMQFFGEDLTLLPTDLLTEIHD